MLLQKDSHDTLGSNIINDSKSMKFMYLPMWVWKLKWYSSVLVIMNQKDYFFSVAFFSEENGGSTLRCNKISLYSDSCYCPYKVIIQTQNLYIHILKHRFYYCLVLQFWVVLSRFLHKFPGWIKLCAYSVGYCLLCYSKNSVLHQKIFTEVKTQASSLHQMMK